MARENIEEKLVPAEIRFSLDRKVAELLLFLASGGVTVTNVRRKYVRVDPGYSVNLIFDLDFGGLDVYEMEGDVDLEGYSAN